MSTCLIALPKISGDTSKSYRANMCNALILPRMYCDSVFLIIMVLIAGIKVGGV